MKATELIAALENGALDRYSHLYRDTAAEARRYIDAIRAFTALYGDSRELYLFSVPGRTEVSGNHTDHNHGKVLAAAIDRDIIAVVARNADGRIRVKSEGYDEDALTIDAAQSADNFKKYSSASLIAGTVNAFLTRGYGVTGFDSYTTTKVLKGSGISSSAAFEVIIGNILNHLSNGGKIKNEELARIAQYAENEYFGKPCGLMDQMACAVGGFVAIDFEDPKNPVINSIPFSLSDKGYLLCIVNTGGNHADLTPDYAAVPAEMKAVAAYFGKDVLRGLSENDIIENLPVLRKACGDRAALRAFHFFRENERVTAQTEALLCGDVDAFLRDVIASGSSSFRFLQNVYTSQSPAEQGISLALCLTEGLLSGKACAWRVHGGGFAGTIQVFVREELAEGYVSVMNSVFGDGAAMILSVRPEGAVQIKL